MGALIKTRGTKLLAAHFNEEFSTHIDFYRNSATYVGYFNTASLSYTSLYDITLNNKINTADKNHSLRGDGNCLLPNIHPADHAGPTSYRHGNLEARWLWFLNTANAGQGSLSTASDIAIANGIYNALHLPDGGTSPYTFSHITFDVVEVATAALQTVSATPALDGAITYMQIVLYTPVMPTQATGLLQIDQPNN